MSDEADIRGGQEHWLPCRAEVIELRPTSIQVGRILRLTRPCRYLHDASAERQLGTVDGMVIFLHVGDGRWTPALLLHEEPRPTLCQEVGEAWKVMRRKKRDKERRLRRVVNGPF